VHPTVRLGYLMRIILFPFFFLLFGVRLWTSQEPAWIWMVFVLHQWLWPHLARRIAERSEDSKTAELRNLLVDSLVIGFFLPITGYSLWPNAAAFLGIHSGNISVGGPRFAARGLLVYCFGAAVTTVYTGFHPNLEGASLFTELASLVVVAAYLTAFAWLSYDRQKKEVRNNRKIRQQHAEIEEQDATLKVRARELEVALEAAQAANAAKSNFLANMSHELRTPLNSIIGFSNILLRNSGRNLREQDVLYLSRMRANGAHLLTLINGVLDLSKIDALQSQLDIAPVDVAALLRETLAELEPQAEMRDVRLIAQMVDASPLATDRSRLKQIMLNLLSNAVKFTQCGTVTVRLMVDETTNLPSRIEVIDTGIGIADDRLNAVFDAFQQEDETTSRHYGGTGLGLTITRSLAHVMGWEIEVRSKVGVGSTFSVLIPATPVIAELAA
jgi:signal transduction histidine kinase